MRQVWLALLFMAGAGAALPAEKSWDLGDPTVAQALALFQQPPPEFGLTMWWGWDGPVTPDVIRRDLDTIKSYGFTSVMIEAGSNMTAKYLTPAWFDLIRTAVDEAVKRDMRVWVEDEGKYPSGFVGGRFTRERPDLREQALLPGERIMWSGGTPIFKELTSTTLCAVAVNLDTGERKLLATAGGRVSGAPPAGRWEVRTAVRAFRSGPTAWAENPSRARKDNAASLCDYLNPEATRQILAWTYDEYKKALGPRLGHGFMGLMSDEPSFAYTPWTPRMVEEFQKRKGYDVRPWLPGIASRTPAPDELRAKADYWDVWSDLFGQNYFSVLAGWAAANNVEYICHLDKDDNNVDFVRGGGDFFKDMRHVQGPGVDVIWAQIWPDHEADYPKMAASASHLFGRARAFSESFAAFTNPVDVPLARWVMDYQLARGINQLQVMFMSASTRGAGGFGGGMLAGARGTSAGLALQRGARSANAAGAPALRGGRGTSSTLSARGGAPARGAAAAGPARGGRFFADPAFPAVARAMQRKAFLLSQGRPAAQIAVYIPTTSLWLGDSAADASNLALAKTLLENQRDFDWVDDQSLASLMRLEGGAFINLSGQRYRAVIVPRLSAISKAALERLKTFAAQGGCVIFAGRAPALVVDQSFLKADLKTPDVSWARLEPTGALTTATLAALPPPDVQLTTPSPTVKYQHRRLLDGDVYFFFNEGEGRVDTWARLAGGGRPQVCDPVSGRLLLSSTARLLPGGAELHLALGPRESQCVVVQAEPNRRGRP